MALNGSISTSSYEGRIYTLSWSVTQSIQDNKSTISWTLSCSGGPQWIAERTLEAALAGKTVVSKTARVERYAGTISSGSFTVDHDVQGNYSFSAGLRVALFGSTVNRTASGSFTLDQIPRQATITSVMDFNDVTNPTIYFNHPAGNALELQACIMSGDTYIANYRILTAEDIARGSYTFNLKEPYDDGTTPESRIWDRSIAVGSDTIDITFRLATWLGSAFGYTNSETKKCTVTDCEPQLSPAITDLGGNSTRLTGGDNNKIVKGHNYLEISTGAVAVKKASIVSQSISCGGVTKHSALSVMDNVESNIFIFTATDNRGKTVTTTVTKELIDYKKLTCNLTIGNPTPDGALDFTVSGGYFDGNFGAVNNSLIVEYRLAVVGQNIDETSWFRSGTSVDLDNINLVSSEPVITDGTYSCTVNVSGLDYRTTYIIQAKAADEVYTGYLITSERAVRCMPVFDWGPDDFKFNVPVNINDFVEIGEEVDINVPVNINDGADISGPVNIKGPTNITDDVEIAGQLSQNGDAHFKGALTYDIPTRYYGDADYMVTSGKYYLGAEVTNRPININGWLEVQSYGDGTTCYQKYLAYTGEKYERFRTDGGWGEWAFIPVNKYTERVVDLLSTNIGSSHVGTQIQLADDMRNYDEIEIIYTVNAYGHYKQSVKMRIDYDHGWIVSSSKSHMNILPMYNGTYITFYFTSYNTIELATCNSPAYISRISGWKW